MCVGVLAGGGGVYLALEKPWRSGQGAETTPDAGPPVAAKKPPRKPKRWRRGKRPTRYRINDDKPIELSDAQKALVWRGSVRPPAQSADFASEGGGRTLSGSEINQVIGSQSGAIIDCIKKARGSAALSATITVKMLVTGQGSVSQVALHAPRYLFEHGFGGCARAAARSMRFAAAGKQTVVTAPYTVN